MISDIVNLETLFGLNVMDIIKEEKRIGEVDSGQLEKFEDYKIEKDKKYVVFDFKCSLDKFTLACLENINYEDNSYVKIFSYILKTKNIYTLEIVFNDSDLISDIRLFKNNEPYGSKHLFQLEKDTNFEKIKPFMESVLKKVISENKDDIIIEIGLYNLSRTIGHANMLYIEQGHDGIHINYYEPQGASIEHERHNYISNLIRSLYIGKYYNMTNYCELGLQFFSKDDVGYCTMFSLLWVYTALKLKNKLKKQYISDLGNIETIIREELYMYAKQHNIDTKLVPLAIYNWVVLFTYTFIGEYNNYKLTNLKFTMDLCHLEKYKIMLGEEIKY